MRRLLGLSAAIAIPCGVASGATTPAWVLNEARQHAELRKLETQGASALNDRFWLYVKARHDLNPTRFDRYHPRIGPILERFEKQPPVGVITPPQGTTPSPGLGMIAVLPTSPTPITPPAVVTTIETPRSPSGVPPALPPVVTPPTVEPPTHVSVPCPSTLSMGLIAAAIGFVRRFVN